MNHPGRVMGCFVSALQFLPNVGILVAGKGPALVGFGGNPAAGVHDAWS
jgi:hypothetical protein